MGMSLDYQGKLIHTPKKSVPETGVVRHKIKMCLLIMNGVF
jgi:hypothetical protein